METPSGDLHATSSAVFFRKQEPISYETIVRISKNRTREETLEAFKKKNESKL